MYTLRAFWSLELGLEKNRVISLMWTLGDTILYQFPHCDLSNSVVPTKLFLQPYYVVTTSLLRCTYVITTL